MKFYVLREIGTEFIKDLLFFSSKEEVLKECAKHDFKINYEVIEYNILDDKLLWMMVKFFLERNTISIFKGEKINLYFWYVYLLECSDKSIYTGVTKDLDKRIASHNNGIGAKYTASRRPVKLLKSFPCASYSEALKIEAKIKKLNRKNKLALIESGCLKDAI